MISDKRVVAELEDGWIVEQLTSNNRELLEVAITMCNAVEAAQAGARARIDVGDLDDTEEKFKHLTRQFLWRNLMDDQVEENQ